MIFRVLTVLLFSLPLSAVAEQVTGKVTELWVNQKIWVRLHTMTSAANLSCNVTRRFVVDGTTDKGKNIYASLLAAKSTGDYVTIVGDGKCDVHSDSEGIAYIKIAN